MIQYIDNSFSTIMDQDELWHSSNFIQPFKAIHFGTKEELKKVKTTEQRISHLEEQLQELTPIKTILIIPNKEEIEKYSFN